MIAFLTVAYVIGPLTAPPIGGLLIDRFGWQSNPKPSRPHSGWSQFVIAVTVIGETVPSRAAARARANLRLLAVIRCASIHTLRIVSGVIHGRVLCPGHRRGLPDDRSAPSAGFRVWIFCSCWGRAGSW